MSTAATIFLILCSTVVAFVLLYFLLIAVALILVARRIKRYGNDSSRCFDVSME